jgi:hypothetical protein
VGTASWPVCRTDRFCSCRAGFLFCGCVALTHQVSVVVLPRQR